MKGKNVQKKDFVYKNDKKYNEFANILMTVFTFIALLYQIIFMNSYKNLVLTMFTFSIAIIYTIHRSKREKVNEISLNRHIINAISTGIIICIAIILIKIVLDIYMFIGVFCISVLGYFFMVKLIDVMKKKK